MNKKDDIFEQYIREKLQDQELELDEDLWPKMEQTLNRKMFFRFGYKHFNIYMVSIGAVMVLSAVFLIVTTITSNNDQNTPKANEPIVPAKDSISISESNSTNSTTIGDFSKSSTRKGKIDKSEIVINPEPISTTSFPEKKDTILSNLDNPTSIQSNSITTQEVMEPKISKTKKIIYIVQQDTIIQKDTVSVRRKKKK